MILQKISKISGLTCDEFGYAGKNKHLPANLKYSPQHVIYNDQKTRLVYFKPSFDDRFIEMNKDEINSIRYWNSTIHSTLVFVHNFRIQQYTVFDITEINNRMWKCKREYGNFLFDNSGFIWRGPQERLRI